MSADDDDVYAVEKPKAKPAPAKPAAKKPKVCMKPFFLFLIDFLHWTKVFRL